MPRLRTPGVRTVAGWTSLVTGGALLVLPGPGIPFVLAGLAMLAPERPWARRLHERILQGGRWVFRRGRGERAPAREYGGGPA